MLPTKGSAFPSGHHLSPHPLLSDKGNSYPFWHGPQESSSVSAKQLGTLLAFSFPTFMAGIPKLVVSSGGALYQPVTMVTSQGQVVTQAIPQGAIQIQNTQVSVCGCVHLRMSGGKASCDCLLSAGHCGK